MCLSRPTSNSGRDPVESRHTLRWNDESNHRFRFSICPYAAAKLRSGIAELFDAARVCRRREVNYCEAKMASVTVHPNRQWISSEDVQGTQVYGAGDKSVGEIDHLLIDKATGRVTYAVMSFGGILGMGHSHYPIPWAALKYETALGGFRTRITQEQLRDAPEFSDDSWTDRDWEIRTHRHYGVSPYWDV